MSPHRLTANLTEEQNRHLEMMTQQTGLYSSSEEYIRALIQEDIERRASERAEVDALRLHISKGYDDLKAGRYFQSTGNFHDDMALHKIKRREWGLSE